MACGDDDKKAESNSTASAQSVDEINARVQRNEMITALLGIGALPLHDIDETLSGGGELPSDAIPSMRTVVRLTSLTKWDSSLKADADAIKKSATDFITAAESDDHGGAAEAATAVHDEWHDFADKVWDIVAPGTSGSDEHADETPRADETPHGDQTPEATP
jgi:hypothetical protein